MIFLNHRLLLDIEKRILLNRPISYQNHIEKMFIQKNMNIFYLVFFLMKKQTKYLAALC